METSRIEVRGQHPFYRRLNQILEQARFDHYVERLCAKYYAGNLGRPSIAPGVYFRCFLIGCFEGISSERGIAYRVSDSLSLREFLGLGLEEAAPDLSTLSKTRRLLSLGTPQAVFRWVLRRLVGEGLLRGQTLEVNTVLRRERSLKLRVDTTVGRAFTEAEQEALLRAAAQDRSPHIYPALMLAFHTGLRDSEIRGLQWGRLDLDKRLLVVGKSKTAAGTGRTVPLNSAVTAALAHHRAWFLLRFKEIRPEWYVFPYGKPWPNDPTRPVTTLKTAWQAVKLRAGVEGRWHDTRHTFISRLAEHPDVSDETIRQLAGHVSKRMLETYAHIRMEAKRRAVEALERRGGGAPERNEPVKDSSKVEPVQ